MGQITIRELGNMDFFREIPKDILQNLLNESKIVSYKKKEVQILLERYAYSEIGGTFILI